MANSLDSQWKVWILFKFGFRNKSRIWDLFRHSRAMHLLESGVNLIYIRDLLGHTSVVTTEIYAKTNPKIKEEQLKKHSEKMVSSKRYSASEKKDLLDWLKKNL